MKDPQTRFLSDREFIVRQVRSFFPDAKLYFFGSRMRGEHKQYSDLDLCIDAGKSIELSSLSKLEEVFSQSDLLYKVDLSDWHRITADFRDHIVKRHTVW